MSRLIVSIDSLLRKIHGITTASRDAPRGESGSMSEPELELARGLMRVNHAGEICAQALYLGQAMLAKDADLRAFLQQSALEEEDHMGWCLGRLYALQTGPSRLAPVWFGGAMLLGMVAAVAGDKVSLGFLSETERQVAEHLRRHLERLPQADGESRAILQQMLIEESGHMSAADSRGAVVLPAAVRAAMRAASRVMTGVAFYI